MAIIAHNGKNPKLFSFLNENQEILHSKEIKLVATGTTGAKTETAAI